MTRTFEDLKSGLNEIDDFLAGKESGFRISVLTQIDVKAIRKRLRMTQTKFSDVFGFSLDVVKHWEGGRRTPEASARAFLTVIAKNPKPVIAALRAPENGAKVLGRNSAPRARKSTKRSSSVTLQQ